MNNPNVDNIFKALSNDQRLAIFLFLIKEAEKFDSQEISPVANLTVSSLASHFKLSQSTISHHIKILRNQNLLNSIRKRHFNLLFPNAQTIDYLGKALQTIAQNINSQKHLISKDISRVGGLINEKQFTQAIEYIKLHGFNLIGPVKTTHRIIRYYLDQDLLISINYSAKRKVVFVLTSAQGIMSKKEEIEKCSKLFHTFAANLFAKKGIKY